MALPLTSTVVTQTRGLGSSDTVSVLTVYAVLLVAIPSDLRIPALGGAGSLSSLWALAAGLWWAWSHLARADGTQADAPRTNPVRLVALLLIGCVLASFVAASTRPLSVVEASQANIGILRIVASVSIILLASDSIPSLPRLRLFLERFIWIIAALAALGLAQFATGRSFVESLTLPGMVSTQDYSAIAERGEFIRAAGTAMSPLEYAAALSTAMPLALTVALYDRERNFWWRWIPVALIGAALMVSGSRSGLLGLLLGLVVLFPSWNARIRLRMAGIAVVAVVALFFLVPGMIGTLRYLFTQTSNDPSAVSRAGSYQIVGEFFAVNPLFGRGFGTFLPEYRILDNQFLLFLIELGAVGLACFLALVATAAVCAVLARSRFVDLVDRQLGQALAAGTLAGAALFAFFDAMAFPMAVGTVFLMIGLCGGYWSLARSGEPPVVESATPTAVAQPART